MDFIPCSQFSLVNFNRLHATLDVRPCRFAAMDLDHVTMPCSRPTPHHTRVPCNQSPSRHHKLLLARNTGFSTGSGAPAPEYHEGAPHRQIRNKYFVQEVATTSCVPVIPRTSESRKARGTCVHDHLVGIACGPDTKLPVELADSSTCTRMRTLNVREAVPYT